MDSITHVVFGAVSGELIAGKKIGKQAMAWGALANSLPDIDVISNLWVTHVESLLTHRGITHSFIFCICVSFFLALLLSRFVQVEKMKFSDWLMIFLTGTFVHIILDSMTAYGTGVFEPFSHLRISLNNIFVADPFYTISLLVGTIALLIVRNHSFSRPRWAAGALIISTLYLCYTFYNKSKADYYFQTSLKAQHIETEKYFSTPTPLNNWLWYAIATTQDSVYIGYFSMFEKPKSVQFNALPKNRKLIDAIEDKSELNQIGRAHV